MAEAQRGSAKRWVVVLAVLALAIGPLVAMGLWRPELDQFVRHPPQRPGGVTADQLKDALTLDSFYAVLFATVIALVCVLPTRRLVRYRSVGAWMARFAVAAGVADLIENLEAWRLLDGHGDAERWLRYAYAAKWALVAMPAVFAFGVLVAWASGLTATRRPPDAGDVSRALAWARKQPPPPIAPPPAGTRALQWLRGSRPPPSVPPPVTVQDTGRTGICFSGGGIRSAAYNLGALQELQAAGELARADFLAGVSGGSYIAGAQAITAACSSAEALGSVPPYAPGSVEEQYLRNRTTYLFPGLGGVAVAFWRLVRGLAVNIAFVALVVFLLARPYGWLMESRIHFGQVQCEVPAAAGGVVPGGVDDDCDQLAASSDVDQKRLVTYDRYSWAVPLVGALAALAVLLGLIDLLLRPKESWAKALETWSIRILGLALAVGLLFIALPNLAARLFADTGFDRASSHADVPQGAAGIGAISTLITGLLVVRRAGPKGTTGAAGTGRSLDVAGLAGKLLAGARKVGDGVVRLLLIVVGGVVGPLAFLAGFLVAAMGGMLSGFRPSELFVWLLLITVFFLVQGVSDANRWSLQPYYKRRLQSAFALRRRCDGDSPAAEEVPFDQPLPFTNLLDAPQLVVCAAVNLTDYGLLPPGRPVATFTFSRTEVHAGILGRVPTREFATLLGPHYARDFTVPAAQAASGAAFAPVMGKMTEYAARFLFALVNLRLGVWLPNPGHVLTWAKGQEDVDGPDPELRAAAGAELEPPPSALEAAGEAAAHLQAQATQVVAEEWKRVETLADHEYQVAAGQLRSKQADLQADVLAARLEAERRRRRLDEATRAATAGPSSFQGYPWLPRPTRLFRELFGVHRATSRFVYVTDGGHYENLGLVELVRRGCRWIYCFDAAGDKTDSFTTLADAVAVARTELGVRIELDPQPMAPAPDSTFNQALHVVGKVFYPGSEGDPGTIVFAKLGVTEDVPPDVRSWRETHPTFPTDGTADQLYTDQRFEAYRALGAFTAVRAITSMREERGDPPLAGSGPLRRGRSCTSEPPRP